MAIKRKSKEPVKVSLPRRTKRYLKFRTVQPLATFVPNRSPKNTTHIEHLPDDVMIQIFSELSPKELFFAVRPVCRRWEQLAMRATLWKKIDVDNEVPTEILSEWIKSATLLKTFTMKNRNDANVIAEELSKNCKLLESVKIQNCWGSSKNCFIQSTPLCHLVTRCRKLYSFNFSQSRFLSRKFFRLISKDKRSGRLMKKCNYVGPMSASQMKALFAALCDYEVHDSAIIGNVNFSRKFKLRDIVRHFQVVQNPRRILSEIWENLNYEPDLGEIVEDNRL